ncbi:MAG TPA: hypothetical protein VGU45_01450 [Microvirga sp.]|jgi:hypothetical protein|nr:hypothetical protein [Microvirga sp.]
MKLPPNIPKRGLTREEAAEYVGCDSLATFNDWIRRGRVPGPIPGTTRWDRKAIDRALDRASGLMDDTGPSFEEWAAQHAD